MASSDHSAADDIPSTGAVDAVTALRVRKKIYSHDQLTPADMELVFDVAQRAGKEPCAEWENLFCDAMTDYLVHQNEPHDFIPQDKADWLTEKLSQNGGISSKTEFVMLVDVMTHALGVPTSLSSFALREIKTAIINGRRDAISDQDHPAGVVTRTDVEALRAVLYAAKTGTAGHVGKDEAEVLFEIAHATARTKADPSFDDLFARAIGNYLMAISVHAPDAAQALHFEKWLDEPDSLTGFWGRMLHGAPQQDSFNILKSPSDAYEADMAKRTADDQTLRAVSETIDESEADWVMAHLTRDGELTSAEKRLLQFIAMESPSIAPSLRSLIDRTLAPARAS
jgi:hypothetical protein